MPEDNLRVELTAAALEIRQLAEQLNQRFVFAESCTSGLAASWIGSQPGISEYFCGSHVSYRNDSKRRWLQVSPEDLEAVGAVSPAVALQMAQGALSQTPEAKVAVSITGHLGPEAPDGLDGVIYIGVAIRLDADLEAACHRLVIPPATRATRQEMATLAMLRVVQRTLQLIIAVEEVCNRNQRSSVIGARQVENVLSGSFNPLHAGHLEMAEFASQTLEGNVHFELSVENVDKPELNRSACVKRILPIYLAHDVVLTRAPTFRQKAELLGRVCFLVGVDTIGRIAATRYYTDPSDRDAAFQEMSDWKVCFLVFGRTMDASFSTSTEDQPQFTQLEDMELPDSLIQICKGVGEDQFRQDVSSRDLL